MKKMVLGRRKWVAFAVVSMLTAAACGGGETADTAAPATTAAPAATEAPAVTEAPAATEASTTTAAPTTTEAMPETRAYTAEELTDVDAAPGSGDGIKIGYISLGESIPFVKLVSDSIRAEAEAAGAEFVFCDSEVDPAKALECGRIMAVQEVDVLINFQLFEDAAAQICEEGPQVPVVSIDIHQRPCETTFFGADNHAAGFMTGGATAKHIEANFNCEYDEFILLNALAAGEVVQIRGEGAVAGFESICGAIPEDKYNLIDVSVHRGGRGEGEHLRLVDRQPGAEVVALASTNDDMLLGALAAFRNAGAGGCVLGNGPGRGREFLDRAGSATSTGWPIRPTSRSGTDAPRFPPPSPWRRGTRFPTRCRRRTTCSPTIPPSPGPTSSPRLPSPTSIPPRTAARSAPDASPGRSHRRRGCGSAPGSEARPFMREPRGAGWR